MVARMGAADRVVEGAQKWSGEFLDLGGKFSASIAGVNDRSWFEQEHRRLSVGARTVLDAARHDEKLPRPRARHRDLAAGW